MNQRVLVQFPSRTQAWAVGQVPSRERARGNHTSISLPLLSFPSKTKILKRHARNKTSSLKHSRCENVHYGGGRTTWQRTSTLRNTGEDLVWVKCGQWWKIPSVRIIDKGLQGEAATWRLMGDWRTRGRSLSKGLQSNVGHCCQTKFLREIPSFKH